MPEKVPDPATCQLVPGANRNRGRRSLEIGKLDPLGRIDRAAEQRGHDQGKATGGIAGRASSAANRGSAIQTARTASRTSSAIRPRQPTDSGGEPFFLISAAPAGRCYSERGDIELVLVVNVPKREDQDEEPSGASERKTS